MVTQAQREELKAREGESPEEWKARVDGLSDKWAQEHREKLRAEREGRHEESKPSGSSELSMAARAKSQERPVDRAISEFEAKKKRLYRRDGSQVYAGEEHSERLGKQTAELREQVEAVVREAEEDAAGYEREALALSYMDPAETVPASQRDRLQASRAFVKEDCEGMTVPALTERISAVSAGSDRVGQVLHARYGRRRLESLDAELSRRAAEERPGGAEAAAERRRLEGAVAGLEERLKDPKRADREKVLKEGQAESRRTAQGARRRLSEADGTDERARREYSEHMRAMF